MKLTWDDIARIQTELDQSWVRALKAAGAHHSDEPTACV